MDEKIDRGYTTSLYLEKTIVGRQMEKPEHVCV